MPIGKMGPTGSVVVGALPPKGAIEWGSRRNDGPPPGVGVTTSGDRTGGGSTGAAATTIVAESWALAPCAVVTVNTAVKRPSVVGVKEKESPTPAASTTP